MIQIYENVELSSIFKSGEEMLVIELFRDWYSEWEIAKLKKIVKKNEIEIPIMVNYLQKDAKNDNIYPLIHYYGKSKKNVELKGFNGIYYILEQICAKKLENDE